MTTDSRATARRSKRSDDDVITVRVLAEHPNKKSQLVRMLGGSAPRLGDEVLCVDRNGYCIAAPGLVVSRLDDSTFRIHRN
jgi:hypothetical protein